MKGDRRFTYLALIAVPCLSQAWCPMGGIPARADSDLSELYRSPDAQAAGNANTATVGGLDAVLYNPAGLAGNDRSGFEVATIDLQGSSDIYNSYQQISQIKSFNTTSANVLMGKDLFSEASVRAGYVQPNFGLLVFSDQQVAVQAKNEALPQVTLGYQTTNGVAFGYGFTLQSLLKRRKKNKSTKHELRFGIGGELLFRRGGYNTLSLSQMLNMSQATFEQMIGNFGTGVGVNAGMQYIYKLNKNFTLMSGSSWTQIGGVAFSSAAESQPSNLSAGVGAKYAVPGLSATFAYDMRHLDQSTDYRLRQHFGLTLGLPIVTLYGGMSEGYPAYGISTDIWLMKITALTYTEELGALLGEDPERRYMLRITMGLGI